MRLNGKDIYGQLCLAYQTFLWLGKYSDSDFQCRQSRSPAVYSSPQTLQTSQSFRRRDICRFEVTFKLAVHRHQTQHSANYVRQSNITCFFLEINSCFYFIQHPQCLKASASDSTDTTRLLETANQKRVMTMKISFHKSRLHKSTNSVTELKYLLGRNEIYIDQTFQEWWQSYGTRSVLVGLSFKLFSKFKP